MVEMSTEAMCRLAYALNFTFALVKCVKQLGSSKYVIKHSLKEQRFALKKKSFSFTEQRLNCKGIIKHRLAPQKYN